MSSDADSSVRSMRKARRARTRRTKAAASGPPLTTFIASWQLALEAAAKSPQTVRGYTDSVRWFCKFLVEHDMSRPMSKLWTRRTSARTCCVAERTSDEHEPAGELRRCNQSACRPTR